MTFSALRAAARIAWRQARRAPGRSALIVAMIAMPIGALTLGATLIRTSVPTLEERVTRDMGSAELKLNDPSQDPDFSTLSAVLPGGSRVVVLRQWNRSLVVDGSMVYASASEPSIPIDRAPLPGLFELLGGRVPRSPGEAAVDPRVLEIFDVRVGDDLTIGEHTFRIVGIAVRPDYMWAAGFVVAPGSFQAGSDGELFVNSALIDLPHGADIGAARTALVGWLKENAGSPEEAAAIEQDPWYLEHEVIRSRETATEYLADDSGKLTGASFGVAVFVLFATGLISAAAFAVGVRRQLRMLGLVGASGGEPAHVRAVVILTGTTLGIVGSLLGALGGAATAYLVTPHLHRITHAYPGDVLLPWPVIVGAVVLGIIAATVTAYWPARLAARISTLDSLAARMPAPRPSGRLARWGLVGVVGGVALTAASARPGGNEQLVGSGMALTVAGLLVTVPFLVQVAGRYAPKLPAASRVAFRETARNPRRTGTAIAAAAVALTMPVTVATLSLSEESFQQRTQWMAPEHLLLSNSADDFGREAPELPPDLLADVREILPGAIAVTPRMAMLDLERYPAPAGFGEITEYPAYVEGPFVRIEGVGGYREQGLIFIGGPDLLRALNADEGIPALEAGKIVAIGEGTSDAGYVALRTPAVSFTGTQDAFSHPDAVTLPAVEAGSVRYNLEDTIPAYVVSRDAASKIGLKPGWTTGHTLIAARSPLTENQIDAVKKVAAQYPDVYVQTAADFVTDFRYARLAAIGAASLIALGIVAVIVALVSAESRRDQAILVAIGAAPRTRRRIAGARSGLVTFLAAAIAVPAGFVPVTAIQWARRFPIVVPWQTLVLIAVGVPVIAAAFGWLTSRKPAGSAMLQPVA